MARLDGISWRHLLGTTFYGQDVFSQLVLGTRQTLLVGFITAILIGFIGTNVGLVSGYFGGIVDDVMMRITDFFYAIPFLPFMMVVVALIDRSLPVIIASMALHLLAHRRARRARAGAHPQDRGPMCWRRARAAPAICASCTCTSCRTCCHSGCSTSSSVRPGRS